MRFQQTLANADKKHIRPPLYRYFPRIDEFSDEAVEPEEGRTDPRDTWIRRRRPSA